jgi:hypothetical protein
MSRGPGATPQVGNGSDGGITPLDVATHHDQDHKQA